MNSRGSLRRRLLGLLLIIITLVWSGVAAFVYQQAQHEIAEIYDANLAQSARVLLALLTHEVGEDERVTRVLRTLTIEMSGDSMLQQSPVLLEMVDRYLRGNGRDHLELLDGRDEDRHKYESYLAVLGRHSDGTVMVRSFTAPLFPTGADGFSDFDDGTHAWRVFSLTDPATGLLVQIGERLEARSELVDYITGSTLIPVSIALPILAILVWFGVGHSLAPLRRLAAEVASRQPHALEPVAETDAPAEARPLVAALNLLFLRLGKTLDSERRFTADAAHELRTPLAALKTQAQVALRTDQSARRDQAIHNIIEGVDRATHLVGQLLTLARADARLELSAMMELDLAELAQRMMEELAPWALDQGVEVELRAEPAPLRGDSNSLLILLRNLLDNAVRYGGAGGVVRVETGTTTDGVELVVSDNGPGIAPEHREAMFERFRRGDGIGDAKGSGLGLSIVQRIAELHGGSISLEAGPDNRGLRVRVVFPANPAS